MINMKKIIVTILLFISFLSYSQDSMAQAQIGGGLVFGFDIGTVGINLRGDIPVTEEIDVVPGFIYYFESDISIFEFNANGHYNFEASDVVQPYALAGLNISRFEYDNEFRGVGFDIDGTDIGLNLGGGVNFELGNINAFAEGRLLLGGFEDFSITTGVLFPIGR